MVCFISIQKMHFVYRSLDGRAYVVRETAYAQGE